MRKDDVVAGRFVVLGLAGSGGMADVYRAFDRTTEQPVALKILRATAPEDLARLSREAQALHRLRHPGIVRYVAHGTAADRTAFVAMEWIEGETLSARLARGRLSLADALAIGRALASALGHAHDHGIVHRDVKPGNVLLRGGKLEDPILLDFGIARTALAAGLTQVGTIIGTPRYMAPEQARSSQNVDARVDVFALGAVLYKCITGRPPFDGNDSMAILAHLLFDPTPDVCAAIPSVPRVVGDALGKLLAKEPEDRIADGNAALRALEAIGEFYDIPIALVAPTPSGLTLRERRLVSLLVVGEGAVIGDDDVTAEADRLLRPSHVDATLVRKVSARFGAQCEVLANGSVVAFVAGRDDAMDLARVSARCALALREAMPDVPIVLATGQSELTEDVTETSPSVAGARPPDSTSSRFSGVFERAAGLLRAPDDGSRPLSVRVDDATAGLLGTDFDVARGAGTHALRGRAIRAQYTLFGRPTPFVGRAREVASLASAWDDACDQGVARAVLVVGDPGFGKSRLFAETLRALETHPKPALRLRGKADAMSAGSPFACIGAALRRAARIGDADPPAVRASKLVELVARSGLEDTSSVAEFVAEVAGVRLPETSEPLRAARQDPRLMGDRIRRAWQTWMQAVTELGPVLIVLEDFQWGDLPTVRLVDDLLHDLSERPVLVLASGRPSIDAVFPGLWSRFLERTPLAALPRKAASGLVREMLGAKADVSTVERVVSMAAGNALFLEELVRSAAAGREGAPETLLAMLQASVEALPDAERRVLRAASVFGEAFSMKAVCTLLEGTNDPSTRARAETRMHLDALVEREMLEPRGDDELVYRNALVRDVAYAMLTEHDRRLGHALAAEWLASSRAEVDPFVLAEHWERGGRPERAVAEYTRSARRALDASDFATALDRVARAQVCGASGVDLAEVAVLAAEAHRWRGATQECATEAERVLEIAPHDSELYLHALRLLAFSGSMRGRAELLSRASAGLPATAPDDAAARVAYALAVAQVAAGFVVLGKTSDYEALVRRLDDLPPDVAERLEIRDAREQCRALQAHQRGDYVTMRDCYLAMIAIRAKLGDERGRLAQLLNLGYAWMWLGHYEDTLECCARAAEEGKKLRLATLELSATQNSSFAKFCAGDTEGAMATARAVLGRAEVEAPRLVSLAHTVCARAALRLGDVTAAERDARLGLEKAPTPPTRMYALAVLADVQLAAGRVEEATATSAESLEVLSALTAMAVGDVYAHLVRADALAMGGDLAGARGHVAKARRLFESRRDLIHDAELRASYVARNPDAVRLHDASNVPVRAPAYSKDHLN